MSRARGSALALPALFGSVLSYQLGASVAKSLFPVFGPTGTVGLRILLSTIVLWVMWRPWRRLPDRAAWRMIVPYGLSLGIMNLLFYLALARITLGAAVAIEFTGPLTLAFLGSRRRLDLLWALLLAAGLTLLLDPTSALHRVDPIGMLLALGAGLCWALYIVFAKQVSQLPGGHATGLGMAIASLAVVPVCVPAMLPAAVDPRHLLEALLVAILSSALPYSLEMIAMRQMSTRTFGILMSLDPMAAALSGLFLLGEHLPASSWTAILCIVLASVGSVMTGEAPVRT